MNSSRKITELELDILLLFYTFSDQFGNVDIDKSRKWARDRYGLEIGGGAFSLTQEHLNILVENGILPDVLSTFEKITQKFNK